MQKETPYFAPELFFKIVAPAVEYYKNAFDAEVVREFRNEDNSIHVAELQIGDALFHLHEETKHSSRFSPETLKGTCVVIGLFVNDPYLMCKKAIAAGGVETSPVTDYEYGYRQGGVTDPFGHHWVFQKRIS